MSTVSLHLTQHSPTAMRLQHDEVNVVVDRPPAKGGGGAGLMGGQYLLLGIAGCFCSNLFAAAQARGVDIQGLALTVSGSISDALPKRFTAVKLNLSYAHCSEPKLWDKLLAIAEQGCLSVNSIKQGMDFSITSG